MDRSEVLGDLDFLSRILSAFPLLHEPVSEPTPVVNIKYSAAFKHVMGLYNRLNEMSRAGQLPSDACPSWLVSLAYTIQCCPAHYTAWQQRREVVMDPARFLASAAEGSSFFMSPEAANEENPEALIDLSEDGQPYRTNWRLHFETQQRCGQTEGLPSDPPRDVSILPYASLSVHDRKRLLLLLPSASADYASSSAIDDGKGKEPAAYSAWHAARWELRQSASIAKKNHKNFQIWHHRKELLSFAINNKKNNVGGDSDSTGFISESDILYPETASPIAFADVDDRVLCDDVLLRRDTKNYHVWQHRAWFVSAFRFLHAVSLDDFKAHCLCEKSGGIDRSFLKLTKSTYFGGGDVFSLYHATLDNCKRMPRGMLFLNTTASASSSSPLQKEVDYSSVLISEDVFNNSAWSYRMHLIEQYIMPAFETSFEAAAITKDDSEERMITCRFVAFILEELSYAVTHAAREVCNECPFVYAKGICEIYARIADRSFDEAPLDISNSRARNALISVLFPDVLEEIDGITAAIVVSKESVVTLMHRTLINALISDVVPIVRAVRVEVKNPEAPYGKRSTFVKLNTHQCEASIHHLGSAVAAVLWRALAARARESPWRPLSDVEKREELRDESDTVVRDGEWLLSMAGISDTMIVDDVFFARRKTCDLYLKSVAPGKAGHFCRLVRVHSVQAGAEEDEEEKERHVIHYAAATMVAHERLCLTLAKKLFIVDQIRSKYWRYEIKRMAFRESCV